METGVVLTIDGERITAVETGVPAAPDSAEVLPGVTIPGLANTHSHAFHRALRGRTQMGTGSFWTWREQMYTAAERLDPDRYLALARATYGEMALAGITVVGEFHYLHHGPDGTAYTDANAMGRALIEAAEQVGVRLTLLDACYLHGGIGLEPNPTQQRFSDGDALSWATRAGELADSSTVRIGAAVHSVRAVDPAAMEIVNAWAAGRGAPRHAHVSEQPLENEQCLAAYGCTPTELLAERGLLDERFTAVHATHLTEADIAQLGAAGATCCFCPTTERDLADGIGPAKALLDAGARLSLGSDSHAVIDLFEEARAVELDERLASQVRGTHPAGDLLGMATADGYACLGWPDGGRLVPGGLADFATVSVDSVRLAGFTAAAAVPTLVFAASAADVREVVVAGRRIVRDGAHVAIDVAAELRSSIAATFGGEAVEVRP